MKPSDSASETPIHFTSLPSRRWGSALCMVGRARSSNSCERIFPPCIWAKDRSVSLIANRPRSKRSGNRNALPAGAAKLCIPNRSPRLRCSAARSARTIFAGQYLQSPAPLGGGLVTTEWFKRYGANELPQSYDRIVQSWDTAHKATELSDFSVCPTGGIKGKVFIYWVCCASGSSTRTSNAPCVNSRACLMPASY